MKTSNLISTPFVNSQPIHTVRPALHQDAATIAAIHVAACQIAYRGEAPTSTLEQLQTEGGTTAWGSLIESPGSILLADDRNETVTLSVLYQTRVHAASLRKWAFSSTERAEVRTGWNSG